MAAVRHHVWTFCFWFGVAVLFGPRATEPPRSMVPVVVDANAIARAVVRPLFSSPVSCHPPLILPKKLPIFVRSFFYTTSTIFFNEQTMFFSYTN